MFSTGFKNLNERSLVKSIYALAKYGHKAREQSGTLLEKRFFHMDGVRQKTSQRRTDEKILLTPFDMIVSLIIGVIYQSPNIQHESELKREVAR